ncbi:MAG: terminase small subunit [Planctomycetaceae bacterium]|nr:terminase small subunit [Planctomycetaceae bacterium]
MTDEYIEPFWLNKKNMADAIGISVQAFSKWKVRPIKKIGRENFYLVSDVIEFVKDRATGGSNTADDVQQIKIDTLGENRRLKKEQADNLSLKNELLRGHSVPAEMASFVLGKIAAQTVSILEQIPGAIKRRLPEISNKDLDVVRKEIATCRNIASKCDQYTDEFIDEFLQDAKTGT